MNDSKQAFTLIELLAVITIIAVLFAVAVPALSSSQEQSRRVQALNQIRQLGIAALLYAGENGGRLPGSQHTGNSWVAGLLPYMGLDPSLPDVAAMKKAYRSPGDDNPARMVSYAINDFLLPSPDGAEELDYSLQNKLEAPSQTLLFTETLKTYEGSDHFHFALYGYAPANFAGAVATERYKGGNVYLFADGRAQWISWGEVQALLTVPRGRFVHPEGNP